MKSIDIYWFFLKPNFLRNWRNKQQVFVIGKSITKRVLVHKPSDLVYIPKVNLQEQSSHKVFPYPYGGTEFARLSWSQRQNFNDGFQFCSTPKSPKSNKLCQKHSLKSNSESSRICFFSVRFVLTKNSHFSAWDLCWAGNIKLWSFTTHILLYKYNYL